MSEPDETFKTAAERLRTPESFDEATQRYRGLRAGGLVNISAEDSTGFLVKPDVASKQIEAESVIASTPQSPAAPEGTATPPGSEHPIPGAGAAAARKPKRFHGTVTLDPARVGRDAARIADEVISHLASLVGSSVQVTLEIEAEVPGGVPHNVVRTVTENARTLKFDNQAFETE